MYATIDWDILEDKSEVWLLKTFDYMDDGSIKHYEVIPLEGVNLTSSALNRMREIQGG
jgi:hypothetical protein